MREGKHRKPIHLAAHFSGVNNTTVWTDPTAGRQIDFDSFVCLARAAERGLLDFIFLTEGVPSPEHRGQIYDLGVRGPLDSFTALAALAAVTDRIGLIGAVNTAISEPFEAARQFASLDHLSGGRAGWNMVTPSDTLTGANLPRGGFLDHTDRYLRAEEFLTAARQFWNSWAPDAVLADIRSGVYVDPERIRSIEYSGSHFDVRGVSTLPAGPQGYPVLLQAGDSAEGRAFGAQHANALFTLHASLRDCQRYYADVHGQARSCGRDAGQLKVFPATTFVIGDTDDDAADQARQIRHQQVSGAAAIATLERVWGRDLSGYDPDGRLPDVDPIPDTSSTQGRVRHADRLVLARRYRELSQAEDLSIRELVIALRARQQFVGTAAHIAEEIDRYVQADACDGFIIVPHLAPHGLDQFVDRVVPILQERGAFRAEYTGDTLREHLRVKGPDAPV